jgi:hypothetical protein
MTTGELVAGKPRGRQPVLRSAGMRRFGLSEQVIGFRDRSGSNAASATAGFHEIVNREVGEFSFMISS